jgi:RNA polymerase sigma factor (sigma-70 family)
MAMSQPSQLIHHLCQVLLQDDSRLTDGQLLGCFIEHQDEAAFAALVKRHASLVWNVCRRLLEQHDAEDAFQASFLVLLRKAASIRRRELLASWLYGVAHQTALQARRTMARRQAREKQVVDLPEPAVSEDLWKDLQPLLDQELSRLPDDHRVVLLLCDLEGRTRKEVAQQLRVPEGTVASRLARARTMLAKRLAWHGLAVTGATLAAVLAQKAASASVPPSILSSTIKAASLIAAGQAVAAEAFSLEVAALTEGVMKSMLLTRLKAPMAGLLLMGALVCGAGVIYRTQAAEQPQQPVKEKQPAVATEQPQQPVKEKQPAVVKTQAAEQPQPVKENQQKEEAVPKVRATLEGHSGSVMSVCFSPDGKTLASASGDKTIKLWDPATGQERVTFKGHTSSVHFVCFSPDGKTLASASAVTVKLWDAATGQERATLQGHTGTILSMAYSPDGQTLATASGDRTVKLWDVASGKERATLQGHAGYVYGVAFSPDGKTVASGSTVDRLVKLWDAASGKERATLQGHTGNVLSLGFSPDGRTLASGSQDRTIKLWDTATGKPRASLRGHDGLVYSVCFSPDGKTLASGCLDKTIKLWDAATGQQRATLQGHTNTVESVAFSPDGKTLASASADKTIKLWDLAPSR